MGVFEPAPPIGRINLGNEPDFHLGAMRVQPAECAIAMNGKRRELQPRMMQVLVALAEARPAVVSRERLVDRCWDGRIVGDDSLNRCILGLRHCAEAFDPLPFTIETIPRVGYRLVEHSTPHERRRATFAVAAILAVALSAGILIALARSNPPRASDAPATVVVRGSDKDPASAGVARDVAVKLAMLGWPQSASIRLFAGAAAGSRKRDLVLELGTNPETDRMELVLMDSADALLWSTEVARPQKPADFEQQVALTAATVLGCALDGLHADERLPDQTFKLYLEACADMADSKYDAVKPLHMLQDVVKTAPRFAPAWAKLLTAEADAVSNIALAEADRFRPELERDLVTVRKLQPDLPEAYIAEYILTPPSDLVRRGRLLDLGVARNPRHGSVRAERAAFLENVGRMEDAVQDAAQAVKLDPVSPITRDTNIRVLALAGRVEAAKAALKEADALWPGASSVQAARYLVDLRVGDARAALQMLRASAIPDSEAPIVAAFLEARIDRSPARIEEAIRQSRNAYRSNPNAIILYAQALAEFGRKEELLDVLLNWRRMDIVDDVTDVLFRPAFAGLHRDPRFIRVADRLGLLGYWRTTGKWPDFCFAPDLPYDCKSEASKLRTAS